MTRFPHDQFAKEYLKELLTRLGQVQTDRKVAGETREIDVWFTPSLTPTGNPETLGILGELAKTPAIFEPFRNPVTRSEIRSCMCKLFDLHADVEREGNREEKQIKESELPQLWIFTPTASKEILKKVYAINKPGKWLPGVYILPDIMKTGIVVIHQLPKTPETLWLRILGKGTVQKQAIEEVTALPEAHPLRVNALELLYSLRVTLEAKQNLKREERELFMQLSPLYVERLNAAVQSGKEEGKEEGIEIGIQQGIEQGIQQEKSLVVENLLKVRFGVLDEELRSIIQPVLELPAEEYLQLLLQLSKEELLARFQR